VVTRKMFTITVMLLLLLLLLLNINNMMGNESPAYWRASVLNMRKIMCVNTITYLAQIQKIKEENV
jgi:hypothetical protein